MNRKSLLAILSIFLIASFVIAACGPATTATAPAATDAPAPTDVPATEALAPTESSAEQVELRWRTRSDN